jgi:hypothetical protein
MHDDDSPNPELRGRGPLKWLTFERVTSLASLAFAAGCLLTTVNALTARVTKLEDWREQQMVYREQQNAQLADFKAETMAKLSVLLERTDPNRKHEP